MSELMQPAALEGGFDPRSAVFDRLLKNRVVMLGSDVNDEIANLFENSHVFPAKADEP